MFERFLVVCALPFFSLWLARLVIGPIKQEKIWNRRNK